MTRIAHSQNLLPSILDKHPFVKEYIQKHNEAHKSTIIWITEGDNNERSDDQYDVFYTDSIAHKDSSILNLFYTQVEFSYGMRAFLEAINIHHDYQVEGDYNSPKLKDKGALIFITICNKEVHYFISKEQDWEKIEASEKGYRFAKILEYIFEMS